MNSGQHQGLVGLRTGHDVECLSLAVPGPRPLGFICHWEERSVKYPAPAMGQAWEVISTMGEEKSQKLSSGKRNWFEGASKTVGIQRSQFWVRKGRRKELVWLEQSEWGRVTVESTIVQIPWGMAKTLNLNVSIMWPDFNTSEEQMYFQGFFTDVRISRKQGKNQELS